MGYDMLYIDILTFFRDYSFRFEKLNQASFFYLRRKNRNLRYHFTFGKIINQLKKNVLNYLKNYSLK